MVVLVLESKVLYLRHRGPLSVASSLLSPQSLAPSQTSILKIHRPLAHLNLSVSLHNRGPKMKDGLISHEYREHKQVQSCHNSKNLQLPLLIDPSTVFDAILAGKQTRLNMGFWPTLNHCCATKKGRISTVKVSFKRPLH